MAGWGAMIGAVMSMAQMAAQQSKKDSGGPPRVDPETRDFYEKMKRRMDSPEADPVYQAGKRRNEQMVSRSQREMTRMTGGDVAATQNAMLQAQREGATNMNQLLSQQGQRQQYFTGLASQLQQRIAQRKLELQQYDRVQSEAQKTQASRRGRANMNAIMTMLNERQNEQDDAEQATQPGVGSGGSWQAAYMGGGVGGGSTGSSGGDFGKTSMTNRYGGGSF